MTDPGPIIMTGIGFQVVFCCRCRPLANPNYGDLSHHSTVNWKSLQNSGLWPCAGRFAGRTLLNIQIGKGEREATNFALRQMLNLATFELLSQVVPPAVFESCRAEIPPEFGRLNLTRSSVALYKYKKSQKQNGTDSGGAVQESVSMKQIHPIRKMGRPTLPVKIALPKNKESEVIQNPEAEPEMSKQELIKYISKNSVHLLQKDESRKKIIKKKHSKEKRR